MHQFAFLNIHAAICKKLLSNIVTLVYSNYKCNYYNSNEYSPYICYIIIIFFIYVVLLSLAIFTMCSKILMYKTRNHCAGKYPILLHLFSNIQMGRKRRLNKIYVHINTNAHIAVYIYIYV